MPSKFTLKWLLTAKELTFNVKCKRTLEDYPIAPIPCVINEYNDGYAFAATFTIPDNRSYIFYDAYITDGKHKLPVDICGGEMYKKKGEKMRWVVELSIGTYTVHNGAHL